MPGRPYWTNERMAVVLREIYRQHGTIKSSLIPVGLYSRLLVLVERGEYPSVRDAVEQIAGIIAEGMPRREKKREPDPSPVPERWIPPTGMVEIGAGLLAGRNGSVEENPEPKEPVKTRPVVAPNVLLRPRFRCVRCRAVLDKIISGSPGTCPVCKEFTAYVTVP